MSNEISMAESYDDFPRIEEAFQRRLDESLNPTGPGSLLSRFTHTVNHPAGSGERARHSRLGSQPPHDPMSEPEAVRFIAQLISEWLSCLADVHGVPTDAPIQKP